MIFDMIFHIIGKIPYIEQGPIRDAITISTDVKLLYSPRMPISNELTEFVDSCLHPDPDKRSTATQLILSNFIIKYCKSYQRFN